MKLIIIPSYNAALYYDKKVFNYFNDVHEYLYLNTDHQIWKYSITDSSYKEMMFSYL